MDSVVKSKGHINFHMGCIGSRVNMSKELDCWVEEFSLIWNRYPMLHWGLKSVFEDLLYKSPILFLKTGE